MNPTLSTYLACGLLFSVALLEDAGSEGTKPSECLRTVLPRQHGGNMDIRYITMGTTGYLQYLVDGCGLAVGDFHYARGDGEVAGTAIEMGGKLTVTVRVAKDRSA